MPQISEISNELRHQPNFRNSACESEKTIKILIKIAYTQRVRIVAGRLLSTVFRIICIRLLIPPLPLSLRRKPWPPSHLPYRRTSDICFWPRTLWNYSGTRIWPSTRSTTSRQGKIPSLMPRIVALYPRNS